MTNSFISNEHTEQLQKLVQEVVNDPTTYLGSKYMPSVAIPVRKIRVEVIEASGGLTNEHVIGADPTYIQSFGTRVQEYEPPAYKEAIHYDEKRILYLRELGDNGRNKRGIRQYIDKDIDRLNRRLEARIEKLRWDTIFNGGFSYMGTTISFGIPAGNRATPGAVWSSNDCATPNNSSNPINDIRNWVMGGTSAFRKYNITKIVMNPNTSRTMLQNTNTLSYLTSYGANPAMTGLEINKVLALLVPGCPPVEVYAGWYQSETTVAEKLTVSDATYFIPNGKIFFECSLPGGDMIGEFVQGLNLASGSLDAPGTGKFLVVDENIAPGTKGGPKNPFIDLVAGVYGGPKLDRAFDVLTADVL